MSSRSPKLAVALAAAGLSVQAAPALAAAGDWIIRAGVGVVDPKSDNLNLGGGASLQVDEGVSATIEGAYMLSDNWAVELLAAWPFAHDLAIEGPGGSVDVGEVKHLPPTLSLPVPLQP